jgi:hypothetical protein
MTRKYDVLSTSYSGAQADVIILLNLYVFITSIKLRQEYVIFLRFINVILWSLTYQFSNHEGSYNLQVTIFSN